MSNVTIKNIPIDFLKNKKDTFFSSTQFNEAVEVFDKYKLPVSDDFPLDADAYILPIEELKSLLLDIYLDREHLVGTESQREDLIYIVMSGISLSYNTGLSPKRFINRTVKELPEYSKGFNLMSLSENIFYSKYTDALKENKQVILQNLDYSKVLKPENTGNTILDVIRKSKFYSNNPSTKVYDDKNYSIEKILELMQSSVFFSINFSAINSLETKINTLYPEADRDLKQMCETLKMNLFSKYYEQRLDFKSGNYTEESAAYDVNILKNLLSLRKNKFPLNAIRTPIINQNSITINHNFGTDKCRIEIYNTNGMRVTNLITTKQSTNNDNTMVINFSNNITGEIILLVDAIKDTSINVKDLFTYYRELPSDKFIKYVSPFIETTTIKVEVAGLENGFIFYDARLVDTPNKKLTPNKVQVFNDRVEFFFPVLNVNERIELIILPVKNITNGLDKIKVNLDNIEDILASINIFDKNIKVWT